MFLWVPVIHFPGNKGRDELTMKSGSHICLVGLSPSQSCSLTLEPIASPPPTVKVLVTPQSHKSTVVSLCLFPHCKSSINISSFWLLLQLKGETSWGYTKYRNSCFSNLASPPNQSLPWVEFQ